MSKSFNFVVKADKVVIKEQGDNNYKVKLTGVGEFLKYQTWSNTNANNINDDRKVYLVRTKKWVELFKTANSYISNPFTPTTVIEIDNKRFVTIMTNAKFKYNKVIFYMSTDDVTFDSKKMKKMNKLPKGEYHNVRFDIDDSESINITCIDLCNKAPNVFEGTNPTCKDVCSGSSLCSSNMNTPPFNNGFDIPYFCTTVNGLSSNNTISWYTIVVDSVCGGGFNCQQ